MDQGEPVMGGRNNAGTHFGGAGRPATRDNPVAWLQSRADILAEQTKGKGLMKGPIGIGVAAVAGIGLLSLVTGSWYTIDATQRGILLRNGAYVETVQPGLHWKLPWIETIYKANMQTHTMTYPQMESYSADQQPANLRTSVTLHIAPDKVQEFYTRFGGDYDAAVQRLISPHVNEKVKVVFGQFTAARAISERGPLNSAASQALTAAIAYDPVFVIESVQIEDIAFSKEYVHSIEQRMFAEVEVQKLRQNAEREKVQAQITVTKATAEADAIRANALATADAIKLKGNAEAEAIRARGIALGDNPHLVELVRAEKWNGMLPTTMVPGGSVPMLNVK